MYSAATGTTQFAYDGDALIAEYDGSGTMLRRYVHSDAADDPLVWYEGSQTTTPRYLYADRQGSIVAVTDASGNPLVIDQYDEWGVPSAQTLSVAQRFGYTGQAWLPELGMYYYKARIYAPQLGRFLQTDPIGYKDQINLYLYVDDDPTNKTDPTGMCTGSLIENKNGTCKDGGFVSGQGLPAKDYRDKPDNKSSNDDRSGSTPNPDDLASVEGDQVGQNDKGESGEAGLVNIADEHTKGRRPSTLGKHEKGQARQGMDRGGEKGDSRRRPTRIRPPNWKGPWPPIRIFPFLIIPREFLDPCRYVMGPRPGSCGPLIAMGSQPNAG